MRFVRKPKPYTSGPFSGVFGSLPGPRSSRAARRPRRSRRSPSGRSSLSTRWGSTRQGSPGVTALSVLGALVLTAVFGSALFNQLQRDTQFTALATHLSDLPR